MNLAINGANGRMGIAIKETIKNDKNINLLLEITKETKISQINFNDIDVIIDFSSEEGLRNILHVASCKIISGTTGISKETFELMQQYGREKNCIIWGSNTSFGVNLMFAMVKKMSEMLGLEYDAEIYEKHHRMKKDAPSGTAITIGKKIAEGRKMDFISTFGKKEGQRVNGEIGFAVERGGKTIGFHEARFISDDETIWFGHEAHDRSIFAKGAVKIAKIAMAKNITGYFEACDILSQCC